MASPPPSRSPLPAALPDPLHSARRIPRRSRGGNPEVPLGFPRVGTDREASQPFVLSDHKHTPVIFGPPSPRNALIITLFKKKKQYNNLTEKSTRSILKYFKKLMIL